VFAFLVAASLVQSGTPSVLEVTLPKRFAVPVRMDIELTPSNLEQGTTVELRVAHDLRWRGCLVFRADAPVTAIVSEVHGPGMVGKPSLIVLDVQRALAADSTLVPLSGSIRAEGDDFTMESIGAAAGVCCLALFVPGGRQRIGKGAGTLAVTTTEARIRCPDE